MCFSFMPVERESVQYSEKETERKKTELGKKKKNCRPPVACILFMSVTYSTDTDIKTVFTCLHWHWDVKRVDPPRSLVARAECVQPVRPPGCSRNAISMQNVCNKNNHCGVYKVWFLGSDCIRVQNPPNFRCLWRCYLGSHRIPRLDLCGQNRI